MPVSSAAGGKSEVLPICCPGQLKRAGIADLSLDTSLYLHGINLM